MGMVYVGYKKIKNIHNLITATQLQSIKKSLADPIMFQFWVSVGDVVPTLSQHWIMSLVVWTILVRKESVKCVICQ